MKCGYPKKNLNNIIEKVSGQKRCLEKQEKEEDNDSRLMVISTFGRDKKKIVIIFEKIETTTKSVKFRYVKKNRSFLK